MKELDEKKQKDICRCEDERCGDNELKHFEECPRCSSTGYHIVVKSFEEVKDGNED